MSNPLIDSQARQEALDTRTSFIVQAPAGSGKTELLTQRMLGLLACVNKAPEQVLAITFTRKAAAEMRSRVIEALKRAENEPEPESSHQKTTWNLAKKVLARDKKESWSLLEQPNRLRILTIDGLCSRIAKQSPIQSQFGGNPEVTDDAFPLYSTAAQSLLRSLAHENPWNKALESLLLHVDNNVSWLEKLFVGMLAKRDQWLSYTLLSTENVREKLELGLQQIIRDSLSHCTHYFPQEYMAELIILMNYASQNLESGVSFDSVPEEDLEDLSLWQFIAQTLLRKDGGWRKTMNVKNGFPAPTKQAHPDDKAFTKDMKERIVSLLDILQHHEDFRESLHEATMLPPQQYTEQQWDIVSALIDVLPVLVAYLQVEFQSTGFVDYIEISTAALRAFGTDENPTDIALNWDYKIEHILIDEFQDTSVSQYQLVQKMVQGWEHNDGRTLFLVGDPMQSIYRFREAEVGLFLRARQQGLAHIPLKFLKLEVNFRSTFGVVDWVNASFNPIFPEHEDVAFGAVPYSASVAAPLSPIEAASDSVQTTLLANLSDQDEANAIVELIKKTHTNDPKNTIAILVRSRTHLSEIIPQLQSAGLKFQSNEIEPLANRMVIRDLISLTKALYRSDDRLAWLSILRAPWCGLRLADLLAIAKHPNLTIWQSIQQYDEVNGLSEDAKKRLSALVPIFSAALAVCRKIPVRKLVESTWLSINGPATVEDESDLSNAEHYFKLLDEVDDGADIVHFDDLLRQVNKLYASPDPDADERLQIMSVHKSKGLEFDTVILPGINKRSGRESSSLLNWLERPREDRDADLILAPIKSSTEASDPIYKYCQHVDVQKAELEAVRLLYVAATRAKSTLHLFGCIDTNEDGEVEQPTSKSFLDYLWPVISDKNNFNLLFSIADTPYPSSRTIGQTAEGADIPYPSSRTFLLTRVSRNMIRDPENYEMAGINLPEPYHHADTNSQAITGTLIHEVLCKISIEGLNNYLIDNIPTLLPFWRTRLLELGLLEEHLDEALRNVKLAISNTLSDETGRWILSDHAEAKSEHPITAFINGEINHYVIDRTFIDENNVRWIIDYKSSDDIHPEHVEQLTLYRDIVAKLDARNIKLAIYLPFKQKMVEVDSDTKILI